MANNDQLKLISTVFSHNGHIPPKYTCEGDNVNPPLKVENIPDGTKTLALIVEDPDAPRGVLLIGFCGISHPMRQLQKEAILVSMAQIVLEKPAMAVLVRLLVNIVISSEFLHWMMNSIF